VRRLSWQGARVAKKVGFVDFETEEIKPRPEYPPKPVGVAIRKPGAKKSRYYAWGHPTGNNCTREQAIAALREVWDDPNIEISFHNGKFDTDVAETHLGLPMLPWHRIHDTMVLAFLIDPHAKEIGLKELAQSRLGIDPEERDAVREWLINAGIVSRANKKSWGAHISKAPGDIVGLYAEGDTDRTKLIFESLLPEVQEAGMVGAYERERRLIPILLENERHGVRVDEVSLFEDVQVYRVAIQKAEQQIFKMLGCEFNMDAGEDLANALDAKYSGIDWPLTPKGARSTSKDALNEVFDTAQLPPLLLALFHYRASVVTCMRNFMEPWLETALKTKGWIHTQWNSVAQSEGGGARSGRFSSSPNFQNIPTLKSPKFKRAIQLWEQHLKKKGLPPLPSVRSYIIADSDKHVILDRDFSQQELRVLAHFEDDEMMQAFIDNPALDLHNFAAEVLFGEATPENRKTTKNIAFGILYGMGLGSLAETMGTDVNNARGYRTKYLSRFSGIKDIQKVLKERAENNEPMFTWGGRRYYCEPPKVIDGRLRTFDYKLFNYLIQGSSADYTKEALIRYDAMKKHGRMLLTVHDEVLGCCPTKAWKSEMKLLKEAMNDIPLGAPMRSDGEYGYRWTELQECD